MFPGISVRVGLEALAGRPWNPNLDGGNLGPGEAVERMVYEGPEVKEGMGYLGVHVGFNPPDF